MARKKNPLDDVAKTVGNWLGGAARAYADITDRSRDDQPGRAARVQAALDATRAIGKVADAATGGFGSAAVSDAQRMAKTGSSTPSALYKTAAVNLAAGVGGAKAAQVAGRAVAATGIPARAVNKLTGKTVMVHGTGERISGKVLLPAKGSVASPNTSVVFGWNPQSKGSQRGLGNMTDDWVAELAGNYSKKSSSGNIPEYNVVVGKVKKSLTDLGKPGSNPNIIRASGPVEIAQVVKSSGAPGVSFDVYSKELNKALRRAGVKVPKKK